MSLVRIPCILVAAVGLHIGSTPPVPPPTQDDEQLSDHLEDGLMKQRSLPFLIKTIAWGGALAESAVIVASHWRKSAIAHSVLSRLALHGNVANIRPSPMFMAGAFLAGLGGFIRWKCYRELGHFFTFEMAIRKDHALITTGPYSVVRHPGYTGALLTVIGMICVHSSPGSWARECRIFDTTMGRVVAGIFLVFSGTVGSGLMIRMPKEDRALKETFGDRWDNWAREVPYRLIPGIL